MSELEQARRFWVRCCQSFYDELYDGWHRTEIKVAKPGGNHSTTAARHAVEVLWSNMPASKTTPFSIHDARMSVTKNSRHPAWHS